MDSYSSRIWSLRKKILELERRIETLHRAKKDILRTLYRANREYNLGRISYSEYSQIWDSTLRGYELKSLLRWYDSQIRSLENKREHLERELAEAIRNKNKATKSLSISLSLLVIFSLIAGVSIFGSEITGFATSQTEGTTQQLVINAYYSIQLSTNSIEFGSLSHNTYNNSAILNNETGSSGYYLELSSDSNVNVDVNISASGPLTNGSNSIGEGNMSWASYYNLSNSAVPSINDKTAFTTTPVNSTSTDLIPGDKQYYRFWIDIPGGTPPGLYENNITFEAYRTS